MTIVFGGEPVQRIIQQDYLVKAWKDSLFPALLFRGDAMPELWEGQKGETKYFSRTGELPVRKTPLAPGTDPNPQVYPVEQWRAVANQFGDTIDTNMPTSHVALANKLLRDVHVLGLNAGRTLNGLARDPLYRAYCSGNTVATAIAAIGAVQFHVASLNGFTESLVNGRPEPVSPTNPVVATFPGIAEPNRNVIAATPDVAAEPFGPGWLTVDATLTVGLAARQAVVAEDAPVIIRAGGGDDVDDIALADVLTLQDIINALAILGQGNVRKHADGYFHHHMSVTAKAQIFADNDFRELYQGIPDAVSYREFVMGVQLGTSHLENTEVPDNFNTGTLRATGANAFCAPEIGAEVINEAGVRIGRTIITGRESLQECYIDESNYITELGVTGKVGQFSVVNDGYGVMTDRIRLTVRRPLDRLQQNIANTWSWTGDFVVPTDSLVGTAAKYKRAVVIEHSLGAA
jgi:hypothetical protein